MQTMQNHPCPSESALNTWPNAQANSRPASPGNWLGSWPVTVLLPFWAHQKSGFPFFLFPVDCCWYEHCHTCPWVVFFWLNMYDTTYPSGAISRRRSSSSLATLTDCFSIMTGQTLMASGTLIFSQPPSHTCSRGFLGTDAPSSVPYLAIAALVSLGQHLRSRLRGNLRTILKLRKTTERR